MPPLPQFRGGSSVAFGPAPTPNVRPGPLGDLISEAGRAVGGIEDALQKKDDEDGRIWAAKTQTELRGKYNQRLMEAQNSGEDLNGLVPKIKADLNADLQNARKASPNKRGVYHLDLATPDFMTDVEGAAFGAEARYRVTKRVTDTEGIIEANRGQVFSNPALFAKAYTETKTLVDGLSVPVEAKARLQQQLQGLGSSAVQGMIESDPYGAAKQLKAGAWNKYLDPDSLASLTNQAQGEIKRREAEAKANAAQARAENYQEAADLVQSDIASRRLTGKAVDAAGLQTIRAGLTDKQWEKYQSAASKADAIFKVTGDMRSQSYAEIQQTVEAAKPKGGEADFAERQAAYAEAQKIAADVIRDRKADPAYAAREAFPDVALAWDQQNANPEDPGHLRVAIKKTLAAQTAMGIAPDKQKPLPAQMAASIAGQIRGAPPDLAARVLQETAARFGKDWSKVYSQIAPQLDANSAAAATLSPNMAAILLETSRTAGASGKPGGGVDDLRRTLGVPASGVGSISALIAEDSDFEDFRRAMAFKGRGGTVGVTWAQAAENLALGLIQRNGVTPAEATQTAIKELVGSKYNFGRVNSVPFVTPKNVDADAAEASARQIMQTFKGADVDLPQDGRGVLTEDTRAAYVGAIQRDGYWVTTTGNTGLELWVGGAPVTHKGQRVTRTWDQLSDVVLPEPKSTATYTKTGR